MMIFPAFMAFVTIANAFISKIPIPRSMRLLDTSYDIMDKTISITSSNPKDLLLSGKPNKSLIEINNMIVKLEKSNPTRMPAESPLLNGEWEFVPLTLGLDPTLLIQKAVKLIPGAFVGADTTVTISPFSPRVNATTAVSFGPIKAKFYLITDFESTSETVIKETFKTAKFSRLPGLDLGLFSSLHRSFVISYLDDDMMIVRDILGSPEIFRKVQMPAFE